ncbi:hypothetical protein Q428_13775 [Fervidicella metallireducens AeB]|uniref:Teneurin-like YD-shell domain-containing protein n=1 Tax=Fervidicella metallireducens AeB TaxID=1403537 RepID=A0A017RSB3_9CLOT|nr:RHS repeat-associated core domain-containing protein [Fervidicella metallireducens]EYE87359.1 hypothetical protein Q428_13775 [Fervidicella metallireducens AeB]
MGRQLAGISGNGINVSFKYNAEGIRTEKTVGTVTTKYHLVGDKVTFESNGTDTIYYSYDSSDNLISMKLNGAEYYYIRNAQGDILGLLDGTGTQVVSYTYDSWGKLISIEGSLKDSVGVKNPYRYRGYRYDEEMQLYYLNSRYYNPDLGRFINADAIAGSRGVLLSHNVFSYCLNSPVNQADKGGFIAPCVVYAAYMYACSITSSTDTMRDLQFIANDLAEGDYLAAALDLIGVLVPGGTGFGRLSKPARKIIGKLLGWTDKVAQTSGIGFKTFKALKKYLGPAGKNKVWHHIVEQCQIGRSGFSATKINNTKNVIAIDNATHAKISAYYSSKRPFTHGKTVRDWLSGQSYEAQYKFGMNVLRQYGVIK